METGFDSTDEAINEALNGIWLELDDRGAFDGWEQDMQTEAFIECEKILYGVLEQRGFFHD